jgi:phage N-6-adenine-methyltransferase
MKTEVMFSKASDEWETPQAFFDVLNLEFHFDVDAAATESNSKCGEAWFGLDDDAMCQDALLITHWGLPFNPFVVWLNPPYSKCREFIAKAAEEAGKGCTVVCLVPSRTDTRWWHDYVWDRETHQPRPGVEVRFVKGRLKFGGSVAGAPFPSVLVIFRPQEA